MNQRTESLPNDPDQLKELVIQLQEKLDTEQAKNKHQTDYINQLIEVIALAKQQHFGVRSEKTNIAQLSLLFNEAEVLADHDARHKVADNGSGDEDKTTVGSHSRRKAKGRRKKLPDHFPHIEVIYTLDDAECHCDHCQSQLVEMSEKTSEQIELIPMTVNVIRHTKKTYRCPNCKQGIKAAKLPPQPIPGSIASPGTIAHVVVGKYIN